MRPLIGSWAITAPLSWSAAAATGTARYHIHMRQRWARGRGNKDLPVAASAHWAGRGQSGGGDGEAPGRGIYGCCGRWRGRGPRDGGGGALGLRALRPVERKRTDGEMEAEAARPTMGHETTKAQKQGCTRTNLGSALN